MILKGIFILLIIIIMTNDFYTNSLKKNTNAECTPEEVDNKIKKMVLSDKEPMPSKMINSCKDGILKGCIAGTITGGVAGGVAGAAVYGIVGPIFVFIKSLHR